MINYILQLLQIGKYFLGADTLTTQSVQVPVASNGVGSILLGAETDEIENSTNVIRQPLTEVDSASGPNLAGPIVITNTAGNPIHAGSSLSTDESVIASTLVSSVKMGPKGELAYRQRRLTIINALMSTPYNVNPNNTNVQDADQSGILAPHSINFPFSKSYPQIFGNLIDSLTRPGSAFTQTAQRAQDIGIPPVSIPTGILTKPIDVRGTLNQVITKAIHNYTTRVVSQANPIDPQRLGIGKGIPPNVANAIMAYITREPTSHSAAVGGQSIVGSLVKNTFGMVKNMISGKDMKSAIGDVGKGIGDVVKGGIKDVGKDAVSIIGSMF